MVMMSLLGLLALVLAIVALARSGELQRRVYNLQQRLSTLEQELKRRDREDALIKPPGSAQPVAESPAPADPVSEDKPASPTSPPVAEPAAVSAVAVATTAPPPSAPPVTAPPASAPVPSSGPEQPSRPTQPSIPTPSPAARAGASADNPFAGVISWFLRGNPLAKLGVLLLFFGLAYLFKYTAERDLLPIEFRLLGAALLAAALLALGWRLRLRVPLYSLILQGGGIGALYLTGFAAFRLYAVLPLTFTFAAMVLICAGSVWLAVRQRALSLALLASLGGYLAPVLLSTGEGSHIALFSYYGLLSLGILAVSLRESWLPLNLVGFVFTFGMASYWGLAAYQPEYYASSQFFLLANLLLFGLLAVLFALRHPVKTGGFVDGTLVFGTPLVGYTLQAGMTADWQYGEALSALGFALLYLPLGYLLWRYRRERTGYLAKSFFAIGGGFATLAVPLAFTAVWTTMVWTLQGLGVLWAGLTQEHRRLRWSGIALLCLASVAALWALGNGVDDATFFLMIPVLALGWFVGGWFWRQHRGGEAPAWLWAAGLVVWLVLLGDGSYRLLGDNETAVIMLSLLALTASAVVWNLLSRRTGWRAPGWSVWLLWPAMAVVLVGMAGEGYHPSSFGMWTLGWPVLFAAALYFLYRSGDGLPAGLRTALHASWVWGLLLLGGLELHWRLSTALPAEPVWHFSIWMLYGALAIGLMGLVQWRKLWPLSQHERAWWLIGLAPVLPLLLGVMLLANTSNGVAPPLPYLPLLNPLELSAVIAAVALWHWFVRVRAWLNADAIRLLSWVPVALAIWWVNGLLLRALAQYAGIDWQLATLWQSELVQTSVSLAWTLTAVALMAFAARRAQRAFWLAGAALLGVVILKLFLVDVTTGGLARAVAFIGVALLVLLVGYLAPLPPRSALE